VPPVNVTQARRVDRPGRARRLAERGIATGTTAWRTPSQRRVLLAMGSALLAAVAFARVAEDYLTNDPLARWDVRFAHWLALERTPAGVDAFRALTFFGSPAVALVLTAAVFLGLYRRRFLLDAALLPLVLAGAELLNLILKLAFHRERPEVAFVHLDTYSFPSGHAMISTAAFGALAYLAWPRLRTRGRQLMLLAATMVLVSLISFSRLYLGVHYLSDVLAGVAGGLFWLSVSIALHAAYGERFVVRFSGSRIDRFGRLILRS
jgi:membrane-associated phospholipid phosphatase